MSDDQLTASVSEVRQEDGVAILVIKFSNMSTLSVARYDGGTRYDLQHSVVGSHTCVSLEEVVGWISTAMPSDEAGVLLALLAQRDTTFVE